MDGGVASYEDAQRLSREIMSRQRGIGLDDIGTAASVEEAYMKARMLMQMASTGGAPAQPKQISPLRDPGPGSVDRIDGARRDRAAFVGDSVTLKPLYETQQAMLHSPCGWNDLIERYCGRTGRITKVLGNNHVKVQFPDTESWVVPVNALERPAEEEMYHPTRASPRRDQLNADDNAAVLNSRRMHRVLLVGDTAEGLEDCKTAYRYLREAGFNANMEAKVVPPDGILEGMSWLTQDIRSGDACFVLINSASGLDGVGDVPGPDLLRPLNRLPAGCKVTVVTTGHACGAGGALLNLPHTMSATREGGFQSTERPVACIAADLTVIGTWAEPEFTAYLRDQDISYMGIVIQALSVCERTGPKVQQFLTDLRTVLHDTYGSYAPLPKVASTHKLADRTMSLLPTLRVHCERMPAASPFVRYRDYTSSSAARLPPPAVEGKCVALGDADTRAWVIFCVHDDVEDAGHKMTRVAVYNNHPCFSLVVYNWVGNDDVIPLDETVVAPHHSKPDEGMVYTLTVDPGETKYFVDGAFVDGDAWRPGWRQARVEDGSFCDQQQRIATEMAKSHAKTRGVSDVLQVQGTDFQDAAFSTVTLLDACCEVARHDRVAAQLARPGQPGWISGFHNQKATGGEWFVDLSFPPDQESLGATDQLRAGTTRPFAAPELGGGDAHADEMVLWGRPRDYHPLVYAATTTATQNPTVLSPRTTTTQVSPRRHAGVTDTANGVFAAAAGPLPNDVSPGKFKSPVVLSALSCIAEQPDLLDVLLSGNRKEYLAVGGCRLQLCVKGWWQEVTIDTSLPMVRRPIGSVMWLPAVTHSAKQLADQASLWPSLLEKGLAKVYGSYGELYSCGDSLLDFLRTLTGRCVRVFGLEKCSFDELCEWQDNGELLVFLPNILPGAERDTAPRLRYSYPMVQYDRRRGQVCVRDNWSAGTMWECEEDAQHRLGEGLGVVEGGRWVSNDSLASMFAQVVRVSRPVGGELRCWMRWGEDGMSDVMLRIEVQATTVFNVLCQQQHHGTTQDVPITLFTRQAGGYLKHYRTFRTSFEVTLSPTNGPLLLALPEAAPCAEGAVLELLYRPETLGTSLGTITACGPAGRYLRALESGAATPDHHPREVLAQHRRDVTNGHPQTAAELRSEFAL